MRPFQDAMRPFQDGIWGTLEAQGCRCLHEGSAPEADDAEDYCLHQQCFCSRWRRMPYSASCNAVLLQPVCRMQETVNVNALRIQ